MSIEKVITPPEQRQWAGGLAIRLHVRIGLCDKGQKNNLQTLSFAAERNGGNFYERINSNE
jgi:hypothetical protein